MRTRKTEGNEALRETGTLRGTDRWGDTERRHEPAKVKRARSKGHPWREKGVHGAQEGGQGREKEPWGMGGVGVRVPLEGWQVPGVDGSLPSRLDLQACPMTCLLPFLPPLGLSPHS